MTRTTQLDIEARKIRDALERAAATNDAAQALEAAREFAKLRMQVTVSAPDFGPSTSLQSYAPAPSRPTFAKYPGRCSVCDGPVAVGASILFRADRSVAHPHCGGRP